MRRNFNDLKQHALHQGDHDCHAGQHDACGAQEVTTHQHTARRSERQQQQGVARWEIWRCRPGAVRRQPMGKGGQPIKIDQADIEMGQVPNKIYDR